MKLPSLNTLLIIGVAVLLTLQLKSCFDKTHKPEQMIRNEERIKFLEEKRLSDSLATDAYLKLKDENISILKSKEATIVNQYIQSNDKIKTIAPTITNLDRENLRAAAIRYVVLTD